MSEHDNLPVGWAVTSLGAIGDYLNGRAFSKSEWSDEGRPIIRIQDLTGTGSSPNYYSGEDLEERYIVRTGDLLVSWSATLGAFVWNGPQGWLNQHIFKVVSFVDRRFHYFLIRTILNELYKQTHGSGMVHITKGKFEAISVALPPLLEQRRIVDAIEEQLSRLDAGVSVLERVRTNLKRYRTAILKAAVEGRLTEAWREENPDAEPASDLLARILKKRRELWDKDQLAAYEKKGKKPPNNWRSKYKEPAGPDTDILPELPEGWCWVRTEALSQFVTSGSRGWAKYYSDDGATFIRMGNLDHETVTLDLSHVQRVNPPAGAEGTRTRVQPHDILVSITAELGMIALAPDDLDEAYINQHVALARPVNGRTGKYLAWYLASRNGNRQLQSLRRGATKIGLGLDDIRAVSIALPPLAEQEQIVVEIERRLSILQEVEAEVEANLKRAARLRQAILKRAFEGKLVPQDPSDEPASELLAQIRSDRERRGPAKRRKKKPARDEPAEAQAGLF